MLRSKGISISSAKRAFNVWKGRINQSRVIQRKNIQMIAFLFFTYQVSLRQIDLFSKWNLTSLSHIHEARLWHWRKKSYALRFMAGKSHSVTRTYLKGGNRVRKHTSKKSYGCVCFKIVSRRTRQYANSRISY